MKESVENYLRVLDAMGWEYEVYIKRGGFFDKNTDDLDFVTKDNEGFMLGGHYFKYVE